MCSSQLPVVCSHRLNHGCTGCCGTRIPRLGCLACDHRFTPLQMTLQPLRLRHHAAGHSYHRGSWPVIGLTRSCPWYRGYFSETMLLSSPELILHWNVPSSVQRPDPSHGVGRSRTTRSSADNGGIVLGALHAPRLQSTTVEQVGPTRSRHRCPNMSQSSPSSGILTLLGPCSSTTFRSSPAHFCPFICNPLVHRFRCHNASRELERYLHVQT